MAFSTCEWVRVEKMILRGWTTSGSFSFLGPGIMISSSILRLMWGLLRGRGGRGSSALRFLGLGTSSSDTSMSKLSISNSSDCDNSTCESITNCLCWEPGGDERGWGLGWGSGGLIWGGLGAGSFPDCLIHDMFDSYHSSTADSTLMVFPMPVGASNNPYVLVFLLASRIFNIDPINSFWGPYGSGNGNFTLYPFKLTTALGGWGWSPVRIGLTELAFLFGTLITVEGSSILFLFIAKMTQVWCVWCWVAEKHEIPRI